MDRKTALHYAAERGHLKVFQKLLEKGAAVNPKSMYHERTPLHLASIEGHTNIENKYKTIREC